MKTRLLLDKLLYNRVHFSVILIKSLALITFPVVLKNMHNNLH